MRIRLGKNFTSVYVRTEKNFGSGSILAEIPSGMILSAEDEGDDWFSFKTYVWKNAAAVLPEPTKNIVYVSQLGPNAVNGNDCGQACSAMVIGGTMTPDQISNVFASNQSWFDGKGLWTRGRYTTFNQHVQFLKSKGYNASKQYFKDEYPPIGSICLINYSRLPAEHAYDKNFQKSTEPWHFVVFMGIGEDGVTVHDPLWKNKDGENRRYTVATWKSVFTGSCVVVE